jgi:hypothetical protein
LRQLIAKKLLTKPPPRAKVLSQSTNNQDRKKMQLTNLEEANTFSSRLTKLAQERIEDREIRDTVEDIIDRGRVNAIADDYDDADLDAVAIMKSTVEMSLCCADYSEAVHEFFQSEGFDY